MKTKEDFFSNKKLQELQAFILVLSTFSKDRQPPRGKGYFLTLI